MAWKPLNRGAGIEKTPEQLAALITHVKTTFPDVTEDQIQGMLAEVATQEIWLNDEYQVHVRRDAVSDFGVAMVHLSIKAISREPVRDWRALQRIKNQLVGEECEAIELFPAESRLVDGANQYHLWAVADPTWRFPIGWNSGRRVTSESGGGTKQRPLDEIDKAPVVDTRDNQTRALDIVYVELRRLSRIAGFKKPMRKILAVIRSLVPDLEERTGPHPWPLSDTDFR